MSSNIPLTHNSEIMIAVARVGPQRMRYILEQFGAYQSSNSYTAKELYRAIENPANTSPIWPLVLDKAVVSVVQCLSLRSDRANKMSTSGSSHVALDLEPSTLNHGAGNAVSCPIAH